MLLDTFFHFPDKVLLCSEGKELGIRNYAQSPLLPRDSTYLWILLSVGKAASLPSLSTLTLYKWSWLRITSHTTFQARQKLEIGQITFLLSTVSLPPCSSLGTVLECICFIEKETCCCCRYRGNI